MNRNRCTRWLVFAVLMIAFSAASYAQIGVGIGISVRIGPPALPVYEQPVCPGAGYLWTPGYWAWNDDAGYYWVPGTWVIAPVGMLWTPGYWGWAGGLYGWHAGYWGPHIGFYGGVNYGFGYGGVGFVGGEWRGRAFFYNSAVMHVDSVHVTNVYVNKTVIVNNTNVSRVSYNGGAGGVAAQPTAAEAAAAREPHQAPLAAQTQHEQAASQNKANFASENHGRPAIAATAKPGEFKGPGVVKAKAAGAPYHAPAMSPKEARAPVPASSHPAAAAKTNNGNKPMNVNTNRPGTPTAQAKNTGGNNAKSNEGFHSFTPPASSKNSANDRNSSAPKSSAPTKAAPQEHASHPAPAPKHESTPPKSAPKPEHHSGKAR